MNLNKIYTERVYNSVNEILQKIENLLEDNKFEELNMIINNLSSVEITDIILTIDFDLLKEFIELISKKLDPYMIPNIDDERTSLIFDTLGAEAFANIINKFEEHEFYDFIHHHADLDEHEDLEQYLDSNKKSILREFLNYPENSVGRLMQKNIIHVSMEWNVRQVKDYLRCIPNISTSVDRIFLIDKKHKINGSISLARLLKAAPDLIIKEMMNTRFTVLKYNDTQKKVIQLFQRYSLSYALVADDDNSILGVITADDVMDVIESQADQNFMHMQYISNSDNLQNKTLLSSIGMRTPWLFINVVFSMLVSTFVSHFSSVIEKNIELAILIPIIASISGISGAQTIATTIHILAKQDVNRSNILKIFSHEIIVAFSVATIMAVVSGAVVYFRFHGNISIVYFISMFSAFLMASLSGIIIPLLTHFVFKLDPAIISPILVTTISDFSAYFMALMLAILLLS